MFEFGLNGYQCSVTPTDNGEGFILRAFDATDTNISATKTVKKKVLPFPDKPVQDHQQVESLFADLFDKLNTQKAEIKAEAAHKAADSAAEASKASIAHEQEVRKGQNNESEDGTVGHQPTAV